MERFSRAATDCLPQHHLTRQSREQRRDAPGSRSRGSTPSGAASPSRPVAVGGGPRPRTRSEPVLSLGDRGWRYSKRLRAGEYLSRVRTVSSSPSATRGSGVTLPIGYADGFRRDLDQQTTPADRSRGNMRSEVVLPCPSMPSPSSSSATCRRAHQVTIVEPRGAAWGRTRRVPGTLAYGLRLRHPVIISSGDSACWLDDRMCGSTRRARAPARGALLRLAELPGEALLPLKEE